MSFCIFLEQHFNLYPLVYARLQYNVRWPVFHHALCNEKLLTKAEVKLKSESNGLQNALNWFVKVQCQWLRCQAQ